MERISIVVIGLNEEKRLKDCLASAVLSVVDGYDYEIIYVDSGSTDRSVEIANSYPAVKVVDLNDSHPSAAKARNLGVSMTTGDFIQFIDGDSALDKDWLRKALPTLNSDESIGAVFGSIEEVGDKKSIYMKACQFDWYTPPGDYRLCGGNALWRRSVFEKVGLFDGELIAGEEPDLCFRVRQQGYRLVCLDLPMVKHDLDMNNFKDYWNRSVRSGIAYATIAMRFRKTDEKLWLNEMFRNFIDPFVWLLILLSGVFYAWFPAFVLLLIFLVYRIGKVVIKTRSRSDSLLDVLLYALHTQFSRIPLAYGQIIGLFSISNKSHI